MTPTSVLFRYVARSYLFWLLLILLGLLGVIYIFEAAELLRRAAGRPDATAGIMLQMTLFKLPSTTQKILPYVILFAGMVCLWRLNRRSELVVMRSAGLSVWEFLSPLLGLTLGFGLFNLMVLNPLGAILNGRYQEMEARYLHRQTSLEVSSAGLWLRQPADGRSYLLHADQAQGENPLVLSPVIAFIFDEQDHYLGRMDAKQALLTKGEWRLTDGWINRPDEPAEKLSEFTIPTDLSLDRIQDSLAAPNTVSFWEMPVFLQALQAIGFPVARHELYYLSLFAQPILLLAMALFAAAFSLRLVRGGGLLYATLWGLGLGTLAFAANDLVLALGESQTLPLWLSAFTVPLAAFSVGAAILLHLEDG